MNPVDLPARDQLTGLAEGRWSSADLTETHLQRIAERNPSVHAVCHVEADRARRDAAASDERRKAGRLLGPLDGLPMTLKDATRVAGSRTTWGLWLYRSHVPRTTARVADALLRSGVVLLGRTAVPTGSFDWNCHNRVYADCVNPYDATRSPGGSSGGAAAALATGMTPLELGSDLGGSIRFPAHCCGVWGLRTTDGWLPIDDVGPEGLPHGYEHLVVVGPMARTLDDLHLALDVLEAAFPVEPRPLSPTSVAWTTQPGAIDDRTKRALDAFLARATVPVVEAAPDVDPDEAFAVWGTIAGFEYARGLPWFVRPAPVRAFHAWTGVELRLGRSAFTRYVREGMAATPARYEAALTRRAEVHEVVGAFFARHPLWVLPDAPASAPPLALSGKRIDGVPYAEWIGNWHAPTALYGTPAVSVPLPVDGLPLGVQVHGPRFADRALLHAIDATFPPG